MIKKKYSLGQKKQSCEGKRILFGSKGYRILLSYEFVKISVTGCKENQSTILSSFRARIHSDNTGWSDLIAVVPVDG